MLLIFSIAMDRCSYFQSIAMRYKWPALNRADKDFETFPALYHLSYSSTEIELTGFEPATYEVHVVPTAFSPDSGSWYCPSAVNLMRVNCGLPLPAMCCIYFKSNCRANLDVSDQIKTAQ
jgi:hypothetical protein